MYGMRTRIAISVGALILTLALFCVCLSGCESQPVAAQPASEVLDLHTPTQQPTSSPVSTPAPTPVPTPVPTPTPEPTPVYATVGAVGDIMMMQSQVNGAWNDTVQAYDFTPSFFAMQPWFQGVNVLCGNLEVPLAGEAAGYSGPAPSTPTPAPNGTVPAGERQTFNAPDALASSLAASGFDVITTANNHCLDRGPDGLFRTAQVLRTAGLTQLGTYLSKEDRDTPRIIEANVIRIGMLAWTFSVNGYDGKLSGEQRDFAVGRTGDKDRMAEDIRLCREAGAEFIIAFVHWDTEFSEKPASSTRKLAQWLLEQGADAVIGSHPHVVQPTEYMTVQRGETEYTGLVVYSMGNFLSNMAPSPRDYGLYVQLTLEKSPDGAVRLYDAGLLPLYCIKHKVEGRILHEVLPALSDTAAVKACGVLTESEYAGIGKARAHVLDICGSAVPPLS